jgi:hypothetical protein
LEKLLIVDTEIPVSQNLNSVGAWHVEYTFWCDDYDLIQTIIDWLSVNCVDNFLVTHTITDIVAGGCIDNLGEFKKNKFNLKKMTFGKNRKVGRIGPKWQVKLHKPDSVYFFMRWIQIS